MSRRIEFEVRTIPPPAHTHSARSYVRVDAFLDLIEAEFLKKGYRPFSKGLVRMDFTFRFWKSKPVRKSRPLMLMGMLVERLESRGIIANPPAMIFGGIARYLIETDIARRGMPPKCTIVFEEGD